MDFTENCIFKIPIHGKFWPGDGPWDIFIIEDPLHKPGETFVIPKIQTLNLGDKIFI